MATQQAPHKEAGHGDTGSGISGVLYKWVNYGRGWRPRWLALSDGVLSYYKIHGPDRIGLSRDTDRGAKVIGEDSLRRLARPSSASAPHSNGHGHHHTPRKPAAVLQWSSCRRIQVLRCSTRRRLLKLQCSARCSNGARRRSRSCSAALGAPLELSPAAPGAMLQGSLAGSKL